MGNWLIIGHNRNRIEIETIETLEQGVKYVQSEQ